jgi:hypothetical protein
MTTVHFAAMAGRCFAGWMAVWTKRFWVNATDLSLLVRSSARLSG